MHNTEIDKTFTAVRQAPLEMDFEQIRQFVKQQPAGNTSNGLNLHNWLKYTNIMIAAALISGLIAALLLIVQPSPKPKPLTSSPAATTHYQPDVQPDPKIETAPVVIKNVPRKKDSVIVPEYKPVILADVKKAASMLHPSAATKETAAKPSGQPSENKATSVRQDSDTTPKRIRTYTSNYCTFDGEDEWIRAFLKALISENIIKDSVNLHFTFSLTSFEVNGEALSPETVIRFNELYSGITHHSLNDKSLISLSVGGSSCTLSKLIDD